MTGFRLLNTSTRENRSRHAGVQDGVASRLQPSPEKSRVRRPANAVGAFDDD